MSGIPQFMCARSGARIGTAEWGREPACNCINCERYYALRQGIEIARDIAMSSEARTDDLKPEHRAAFRHGFAAARYAIRDQLNDLLKVRP